MEQLTIIFNASVEKVLNNNPPLKEESVRVNDDPVMAKALRKAIMPNTRLRNMYNKCKTQEKSKAAQQMCKDIAKSEG